MIIPKKGKEKKKNEGPTARWMILSTLYSSVASTDDRKGRGKKRRGEKKEVTSSGPTCSNSANLCLAADEERIDWEKEERGGLAVRLAFWENRAI